MDLTLVIPLVSLILGVGVITGAALVALVVARRRGLDQVEDRSEAANQKTLNAQDRRLELQDREIADLRAQVLALSKQVADLQRDLDLERRISLRFRDESHGTPA